MDGKIQLPVFALSPMGLFVLFVVHGTCIDRALVFHVGISLVASIVYEYKHIERVYNVRVCDTVNRVYFGNVSVYLVLVFVSCFSFFFYLFLKR